MIASQGQLSQCHVPGLKLQAAPQRVCEPDAWTWLMTAQERKDFRRVQKSRDLWKKRAVARGEDRRRIRERHKEVDGSRNVWRDRALEAMHRIDWLEIENHRLKSALTRVPQPSTIDNTHFF